jgi:hypothetical protein
LDYGNALNFQRKFFLRMMKNRLPDPSEICALDFKQEFRRFAIPSVSATIGIDRPIFRAPLAPSINHRRRQKTVTAGRKPERYRYAS